MKYIKQFLTNFYKLFAMTIRFKENVIVFESSMFRNYTGNPRYIYEEFVRQGLDEKFDV
ncbi:MAG TPA: CDP-glycerol--glycerophosphate glycerophosphotransferase, partial [Eubacterium sp.]|nr:CDP-glycerol--glycerophosphate glycerophosphotransferase [Eubacterium sp.]